MDKLPDNPIDSAIPSIASAVATWKKENPPEKLAQRITEPLDKQLNSVTLQMLGFTDHWGKWELRNTGQDNNAAANFFREARKQAIKDWLSTVQLPTLPPKLKKETEKALFETYEYEFHQKLRELTRQKAEQDATELVAQLLPSRSLDNYLKTIALIEGETVNPG